MDREEIASLSGEQFAFVSIEKVTEEGKPDEFLLSMNNGDGFQTVRLSWVVCVLAAAGRYRGTESGEEICSLLRLHGLEVGWTGGSIAESADDECPGCGCGLDEGALRCPACNASTVIRTNQDSQGGAAVEQEPRKFRKSRYHCKECRGSQVEVCLPGWYEPNSGHRHVGKDEEARILAARCSECDEAVAVWNPWVQRYETGRWE